MLTMDLHSPQIQGFFKRPVDHMHARSIICDYIRTKNLDNLVVASADVGYGKNAFKFSDLLGVPYCNRKQDKSRPFRKCTSLECRRCQNKNVLIVDDIVFTGGSLISMTEAVKSMGAKKVYAAVTHGVLTLGQPKRLTIALSKN